MTFFGIFHVYGLIVGLAIWLAATLIEYQAKKYHLTHLFSPQLVIAVVAGGLIGARVYHVLTDVQQYVSDPLNALFIWRGGMSIIGGILGGAAALIGYCSWRRCTTQHCWQISDVLVLGIPFGQALGRLGNWVNYELYGLPTTLPWGITIPPAFRLAGYEQFAFYHPLFAYESVAMLIIGGVLWWQVERNHWRIGSSTVTFFYLFSYACVRFVLEFLRIDKHLIVGTPLSVNQVILALSIFVILYIWWQKKYRTRL